MNELEKIKLELEQERNARLRAEEELALLRQRESLFHDMVDNIPGVVIQYSSLGENQGVHNYVSPRLKELFGLAPEDLLVLRDFLYEDDKVKWDEATRISREENKPWVFEGRLLVAGDHYKWIHCAAVASQISTTHAVYNVLMLDIDAQKKAEEALFVAKENWELAFESSGDGLWEYMAEKGICSFSQNYKKILGYNEDDWKDEIGEWLTRIHPDDKQVIVESDIAYESGEQQFHVNEYRMRCKDGSYKWVMDRGMVLDKNTEGKPTHFLGILTDIDRQKKLQAQLTTMASRLSSLVSNLQAGIMLLNDDEKVLLANESFIRIFQLPFSSQQMVGMPVEQVLTLVRSSLRNADRLFGNRSTLRKVRKKESNLVLELIQGKFLSLDYIPIFNGGQFEGHMFKFLDITGFKLAEQKLQKEEAKYRGIIENMELGLVECDNDQKIIYANQSFCTMSGYSLHELKGKTAVDTYMPHGAEIMAEKHMLRNIGVSDNYEVIIEARDGSSKWCLISGAPRYDDHGKVIGSLGIHLDITSRRQTEKELQEARREAVRSSQVKELFLANVSHEIRTPLNAVIGFSRQLLKTDLDEQQSKYANVIGTAANNLLTIINDILDFSKIENGTLAPELKAIHLAEVISNVAAVLKQRVEEKGLDMQVDISDEIAPVLMADTFHINQVILNLLSNAIKYTEKGSIGLSCSAGAIQNGHQEIRLLVSDTGIGMEPAFLAAMQEQLALETNSSSTGITTGLGLSITKELVELMHGSMTFKSTRNQGTQVFVTLLLAVGEQKDLPLKEPPFSNFSILKNKEVLVVEDNEMNQMVADAILSHQGIQVTLADNGREALEKLSQQHFDLVLMDMKMPVMDGLETTRQLRSRKYRMPVIALTANALKGEEEKCMKAGMDDYMTKPFEEEILLAKVAKWLVAPAAGENEISGQEEQALFSLHTLEEIAHGNLDFVKAMVGIFIQDAGDAVAGMNQAMAERNMQTVHDLAHKIKPSLSNFNIDFVDEIKQIELLSLNGSDPETLIQLLSDFSSIIQKVIAALKQWEVQGGLQLINEIK